MAEREVEAIGARLDDLPGRQWESLVRMHEHQIAIQERIETRASEFCGAANGRRARVAASSTPNNGHPQPRQRGAAPATA